jgi:hypothetical protein
VVVIGDADDFDGDTDDLGVFAISMRVDADWTSVLGTVPVSTSGEDSGSWSLCEFPSGAGVGIDEVADGGSTFGRELKFDVEDDENGYAYDAEGNIDGDVNGGGSLSDDENVDAGSDSDDWLPDDVEDEPDEADVKRNIHTFFSAPFRRPSSFGTMVVTSLPSAH